ncbi:glycoside hydrolase family 5 protein [Flagelloscypha sp. PMI_526]|nr:glycoside hydrolase family 5 protein [Flagelloscypha sp. PMI_526]
MLLTTPTGFVDSKTGRQVLLRGVNLSGSSKAPVDEPTHFDDGFWERAEAAGHSFVGRPFSLEEADEHLRRLKGWGFNFIRYPIFWEALEREGPGKYDYEFMDFTIEILKKCKEWGFWVFIDPHQDVWSRFTGGSGAPYWTLPLLGVDPKALHDTWSAVVHHEWSPKDSSQPDPSELPSMIWSTNYGRLFSQTAFTMFWASRDFAPRCTIDGKPVGEWMQDSFVEAFGILSDRITEKAPELLDDCIIGWDGMNEPFEGLISYDDLTVLPTKQGGVLKKGPTPTPIQGMRLGLGMVQTVEDWGFGQFGPSKNGTVVVDPKGVKLWVDPEQGAKWDKKWGWERGESWTLGTCPWALHGVWDLTTGECLKPDYFQNVPSTSRGPPLPPHEGEGSPSHLHERRNSASYFMLAQDLASPDFLNHYFTPFFEKLGRRIRKAHPNAILFVQPPVFSTPPTNIPADLLERAAYAPHYYDGLTLVSKHWNWFNADALGLIRGKYGSVLPAVKIGNGAIRKSLQEQLALFIEDTHVPVVVGEIGTPFDMDNKKSYYDRRYKGNFATQETALDASLNGTDGTNCLNFTLWTYCPDGTHEWGDGWNGEDLSLWNLDDARRHLKAWSAKNAAALKKQSTVSLPPMLGVEDSNLTLAASSSSSPGPSSTPNTRTPPPSVRLRVRMPGAMSTTTSLSMSTAAASVVNLFLKDQIPSFDLTLWQTFALGSRAVRAFARPYPTHVAGVVNRIDWDIAKALFKCSVNPTSALKVGDAALKDEQAGVTEIYVPLIHYASESVLTSGHDDDVDSMTMPEEGEEVVDLDVKCSTGTTWRVVGQKVLWNHGTSKESGNALVWIEIRRKGGVLPFNDLIKGRRTMGKGASKDPSCADGDGCVVM